ncbi:MAG TPA: hypothetical protein VF166_00785 [Gemmatimonadaceae bacterium]
MATGTEFLKHQVNNAVVSHRAFLDALKDHKDDASDPRFRDLCTRYIQPMQDMQNQLEAYQKELGADEGLAKKVIGGLMGGARDLADIANDDFLRLVRDIILSDQNEDTFRTFREAGRQLGNTRLQEIGTGGEQGHDNYKRDANRLVQSMFVESVRGTGPQATTQATTEAQAGTRPRPAV